MELESTKQKGKENIEQAILIERERVTQMQWDMEELRRKSLEMEFKLNSQQVLHLNYLLKDLLPQSILTITPYDLPNASRIRM